MRKNFLSVLKADDNFHLFSTNQKKQEFLKQHNIKNKFVLYIIVHQESNQEMKQANVQL
jgi:hypothetical protein